MSNIALLPRMSFRNGGTPCPSRAVLLLANVTATLPRAFWQTCIMLPSTALLYTSATDLTSILKPSPSVRTSARSTSYTSRSILSTIEQ